MPSPTPLTASAGWEARTLIVAPGQPGRLYILMVDRYTDAFPSERMRFLYSDDMGTTWIQFPGGLPAAPSCVHNVNLDYATRDALYASTCQGLYRWSGDGWKLVSSQETGMVAIVYKQPNIIWATAAINRNVPVLRSDDGGSTWQAAATGIVHFNGVANLAVDPRDARTLYAIIWPKYGGSYLRRGTSEGRWMTMPTPLNNAQIDIGMTIDGATGDLYVTAYNYLNNRWGVWRNRNPNTMDVKDVTWELVDEFAEGAWATILASGWSPQGLALYARLAFVNGDSVVMRSLDGGKTWTRLTIQ